MYEEIKLIDAPSLLTRRTLPNSNVQGNLEDFNWTSLDTLKYMYNLILSFFFNPLMRSNLVQNNISGDIQSIIKSCPNLVNLYVLPGFELI